MSTTGGYSFIRTRVEDRIAERTTPVLGFSLVDEDGQPITSVDTLTMRIDTAAGVAVSEERSIKTDFADGDVETRLTADDTRIVGDASEEVHIALISWTWGGSPARSGRHQIVFTVANLIGVS